jgi:hypothetical protein
LRSTAAAADLQDGDRGRATRSTTRVAAQPLEAGAVEEILRRVIRSWFFDAGYDDATVSFQNSNIIVEFAREAPSSEEVIAAAVERVRAAGAAVDRSRDGPTGIKISAILRRVRESALRSGHKDTSLSESGLRLFAPSHPE